MDQRNDSTQGQLGGPMRGLTGCRRNGGVLAGICVTPLLDGRDMSKRRRRSQVSTPDTEREHLCFTNKLRVQRLCPKGNPPQQGPGTL